MHSARVSSAEAVSAGLFLRERTAKRMFWSSKSMGGRPSAHRGQLTLLDHLAVEEMHGAVGVAGVARVVRDHTDGGAALMQLTQQLHHRFAVGGVEVAG